MLLQPEKKTATENSGYHFNKIYCRRRVAHYSTAALLLHKPWMNRHKYFVSVRAKTLCIMSIYITTK